MPLMPPTSVSSFCGAAARMGLVIVEYCGLFAKDSEYMGVIPFVPELWAPTPGFWHIAPTRIVARNNPLVNVEIAVRAVAFLVG